MSPAEATEFEACPAAGAALRLRRWDEAAKDPTAMVPPFARYQPMLRRLALYRGAAGATR
jgi:gamma-butyrobetaine dioxygenase